MVVMEHVGNGVQVNRSGSPSCDPWREFFEVRWVHRVGLRNVDSSVVNSDTANVRRVPMQTSGNGAS